MADANRLSIGKWMRGSNENALIWPDDDGNHNGRSSSPKTNPRTVSARVEGESSSPVIDWMSESKKCLDRLSTDRLDALVRATGVPCEAWKSIGIGWVDRADLKLRWGANGADWYPDYPDGAYTIPERNGAGEIVGLALRDRKSVV